MRSMRRPARPSHLALLLIVAVLLLSLGILTTLIEPDTPDLIFDFVEYVYDCINDFFFNAPEIIFKAVLLPVYVMQHARSFLFFTPIDGTYGVKHLCVSVLKLLTPFPRFDRHQSGRNYA